MYHQPVLVTSSRVWILATRSRRSSSARLKVSLCRPHHHQRHLRLAVRTAWTSSTTDSSTNCEKLSRAAVHLRKKQHVHESRIPLTFHLRLDELPQTNIKWQVHRMPPSPLWSDSFNWWRWIGRQSPKISPKMKTNNSVMRNSFWSESTSKLNWFTSLPFRSSGQNTWTLEGNNASINLRTPQIVLFYCL